jgi:hypothetical protein
MEAPVRSGDLPERTGSLGPEEIRSIARKRRGLYGGLTVAGERIRGPVSCADVDRPVDGNGGALERALGVVELPLSALKRGDVGDIS